MKQSDNLANTLFFALIFLLCGCSQKNTVVIKYREHKDFSEEVSKMIITKSDSIWTAELVEKGKKYRSDKFTSSQMAAVDNFILDLKNFHSDNRSTCTSVDYYEVTIGNQLITREDQCANWLGYKLLRQKIFAGKF